MRFADVLEADILSVIVPGWNYRVTDITKKVAPMREREVRAVMNSLWKRGILKMNRGGGAGHHSMSDQPWSVDFSRNRSSTTNKSSQSDS